METKFLTEHSIPTKDLIKESFMVGSGSIEAHALYIKGLSLHLNTTYDHVFSVFQSTIIGFNKEDIADILGDMARVHGDNPQAKEGVNRVFKRHKVLETSDIIISQIPGEEELYRGPFRYIDFSAGLNKALIKAWETKDQDKRIADLKSISAGLNLYATIAWWKALSNSQKEELQNKGKELLRAPYP